MVESVESLMTLDFSNGMNLDASQWKSYFRMVNLALSGYMEQGFPAHCFTIYRALDNAEYAVSDLYTLEGSKDIWKSDCYQRLRVTIEFIADFIEILGIKDPPQGLDVRSSNKTQPLFRTIYDRIASSIFELIYSSASIGNSCTNRQYIQYSTVLVSVFSRPREKKVWKIVLLKVRRLIYDEIIIMNSVPNFKGAKIINFCLNTMGLISTSSKFLREVQAIHRVTLSWIVKNYVWLHDYNSKVAETCLPEEFTYNASELKLIRIKPATGLNTTNTITTLELNPKN
jgi:hypothetical protein